MSQKPETVFIGSVHKHLPLNLYRVKNNNPFTGGIPDVWYSGVKADLWAEYKFIERVPAAGVAPSLSALQTKWLRDRHLEGRNVAVIVGSKDGGMVMRDLTWENLIPCETYKTKLLTRQELAQWIQSEVGESNDKVRSKDIPGARRAPAASRRQPADVCRPVRQRSGQSTRRESKQSI